MTIFSAIFDIFTQNAPKKGNTFETNICHIKDKMCRFKKNVDNFFPIMYKGIKLYNTQGT